MVELSEEKRSVAQRIAADAGLDSTAVEKAIDTFILEMPKIFKVGGEELVAARASGNNNCVNNCPAPK